MQKKIIIAILLTVIIISVSLGVISYIAVRESIDNTMQHKLELSRIVAKNIDHLLSSSVKRLFDISLSGSIDLSDNDWSNEREALRKAYDYSIFSDGLFIIDRDNRVVYTYPSQHMQYVNTLPSQSTDRVITEGKPFISDIFTVERSKKKLIHILVPLRNKNGGIEGAVGGEIDPSAQNFNEIIRSVSTDKNAYMELVDSQGFVIASSDAKRVFKDQSEGHSQFLERLITEKKPVITKCHRCHTKEMSPAAASERSVDIMAFAPLETAPWSVSIVQPEKDILMPITKMKMSFLAVSVLFIAVALVLAIGMSRSIIRPVHQLIDATLKIAEGDMSEPIAFGGRDEIGKLSSSFEVMRIKLADSLDDLQKYNATLEQLVMDRTRQISDSRLKIKDLLKKVITSQEDERKRIARELHDVIMQDLAATLIKIDICCKYPDSINAPKMDDIKTIIEKNLDDVYRIIKNLRPSILDDLGFEAAVRWLCDHHLESNGIRCYISIYNTISDIELTPQHEIGLFRIIQEAITNISKHAEAENVFILLEIRNNQLIIEIEDDGSGFDLNAAVFEQDSARGLGLLGMKERASFFAWDLKICSAPGEGTRLSLKVPLTKEVWEYA
jgi:signal transduction histidine kinase